MVRRSHYGGAQLMRGNVRALNASLRTADLSKEEADLAAVRRHVDEIDVAIQRGRAEQARLREERARMGNSDERGRGVSTALLQGDNLPPTIHAIDDEISALGEGLADLGRQRRHAATDLRIAQESLRRAYGRCAAPFVDEVREEVAERLCELATLYATLRAIDTATGGDTARAVADGLANCIGQDDAFTLGLSRIAIPVPADVQAALETDLREQFGRRVPDAIDAPRASSEHSMQLIAAASKRAA